MFKTKKNKQNNLLKSHININITLVTKPSPTFVYSPLQLQGRRATDVSAGRSIRTKLRSTITRRTAAGSGLSLNAVSALTHPSTKAIWRNTCCWLMLIDKSIQQSVLFFIQPFNVKHSLSCSNRLQITIVKNKIFP